MTVSAGGNPVGPHLLSLACSRRYLLVNLACLVFRAFEGLTEMSHPGGGGQRGWKGRIPVGGAREGPTLTTGIATGNPPRPCRCIAAAALKFGGGGVPLCSNPGPNSSRHWRKGKSGICGGCRQEGSSGKAIWSSVLVTWSQWMIFRRSVPVITAVVLGGWFFTRAVSVRAVYIYTQHTVV